jgi:predicted nucleic acid-binding protein
MRQPPLVYLDTNFLVRAVELQIDRVETEISLMNIFRRHPGAAVTSELTLAELLAPTANSTDSASRRTIYRELLIESDFIDLEPVSRAVLMETVSFREMALAEGRRPKLPDAIHVVTAAQLRCRFFASDDLRLGAMPSPLQVLPMNALGVAAVLKALNA